MIHDPHQSVIASFHEGIITWLDRPDFMVATPRDQPHDREGLARAFVYSDDFDMAGLDEVVDGQLRAHLGDVRVLHRSAQGSWAHLWDGDRCRALRSHHLHVLFVAYEEGAAVFRAGRLRAVFEVHFQIEGEGAEVVLSRFGMGVPDELEELQVVPGVQAKGECWYVQPFNSRSRGLGWTSIKRREDPLEMLAEAYAVFEGAPRAAWAELWSDGGDGRSLVGVALPRELCPDVVARPDFFDFGAWMLGWYRGPGLYRGFAKLPRGIRKHEGLLGLAPPPVERSFKERDVIKSVPWERPWSGIVEPGMEPYFSQEELFGVVLQSWAGSLSPAQEDALASAGAPIPDMWECAMVRRPGREPVVLVKNFDALARWWDEPAGW